MVTTSARVSGYAGSAPVTRSSGNKLVAFPPFLPVSESRSTGHHLVPIGVFAVGRVTTPVATPAPKSTPFASQNGASTRNLRSKIGCPPAGSNRQPMD
jgi:hypothetical protein